MRTASLIATALTLALAAPAWAQRYDDRDNRYGDRYPSRGEMEHVQRLANDVEQHAYVIRRTAERNNRRPDWREARVLAQLAELDGRARQFHREVDGYRNDPRETRRDFRVLVRTYEETWDALDTIARRPYIDRGMVRIGSALRDLSLYYGRARGERWDDWERYGTDRDGRYDRRDGDRRGGYGDDGYNGYPRRRN